MARLGIPYLSKVPTAEALSLHEKPPNILSGIVWGRHNRSIVATTVSLFPPHTFYAHFTADPGSPFTYLSIKVIIVRLLSFMTNGSFQICNKLFADDYVLGNITAYLHEHQCTLFPPPTAAHFGDINILGASVFFLVRH